jgi:hypothetical protein
MGAADVDEVEAGVACKLTRHNMNQVRHKRI